MSSLLDRVGVTVPVFAAPMAGGPTTPAMVIAAGSMGSFGLLAGGYKSAAALAGQIQQVRESGASFGVNLFAPNPLPVDGAAYRSYAEAIKPDGDRLGVDVLAMPVREDDDEWTEKVDLLTREPVPVVSFTFGLPDHSVVQGMQQHGTVVIQTVTSSSEAVAAAALGVDALAVQSHEAGGHFGTLTPHHPSPPVALSELVAAVRSATGLPVIGAGGLDGSERIKPVLAAGADAVMVGTYLLRTDESGASATYKAALLDRRDHPTAVTRAFSGRPARGIRNGFVEKYDAIAPFGYPALHHLTSPLRKAAAEAGNADLVNLWAGTGHATTPDGPVADALTQLAAGL